MPVQTQMQVRRGTASSWTSTNPTLAAGELGFETDTGKFKIGTGSSTWTALPYAGGGQNTLTTYQYTATAGQTTFSGADINSNTLSYTAGAVQVYLNGALLQNTVDYAASTGTSVVLTAGAGLGDSLTILSLGSFTVSTDIPKSTLTAKGSIVAASGAATPANLSVGANDTVLMADSSTATGLKWATPAAGGMTLIGSTATDGVSNINFTSLAQTYKHLLLVWTGVAAASPGQISLRANADTSNYIGGLLRVRATTVTGETSTNFGDFNGQSIDISTTANAKNAGALWIYDYASTTQAKFGKTTAYGYSSNFSQQQYYEFGAYYNVTTAVTQVNFVHNSGAFANGGLVRLYGVS